MMSWTFAAKETPASLHSDAQRAIRRAVRLERRANDIDFEYACEVVGDMFDLTPRRVRSWCRDEIFEAPARECRAILERWRVACDIEVARLRELADQQEQALEREIISFAQFELPLGSANVQTGQGVGRGSANAMVLNARRHLDRIAKAHAEYRRLRRGPLK